MTAPDHDRLFDELGLAQPAPDLTDQVMGRMGLSRSASRRRRLLRNGVRLSLCVLAVGLAVIGVRIYQKTVVSPAASAITIPSAVQQDLQLHGDAIDRALRTIKNLTPQLPEPAATSPEPEPLELHFSPEAL